MPVTNVELNKLTEDQKKWWEEISKLPIELYGLADQTVGNIATPYNYSPAHLNLKLSAPAGVVALENVLSVYVTIDPTTRAKVPKFQFKNENNYVMIRPAQGLIDKTTTGKYVFIAAPWT